MPIDRKNSFHLMLSDDELTLLRLLAEREGLNASDYLRWLLRQMAGTPQNMAHAIRLGAALAGNVDFGQAFAAHVATAKASSKAKAKPKRTKTK